MPHELDYLVKILIAALLGGIVGAEREKQDKPAGLRTHMLLAAVAALFALLGRDLILNYENLGAATINADPTRIIQAVVIGVSFVGGGLILKDPSTGQVKNLTTAATTLMATGIGIAVAVEQYYVAFGVAVIVLVINSILYRFESTK